LVVPSALASYLCAVVPNSVGKPTRVFVYSSQVRLQSQQRFAAYDKRGAKVAGDPATDVVVEDIWVVCEMLYKISFLIVHQCRTAEELTVNHCLMFQVERAVYNPEGRWVLAARLTV
jgi:hypothetical protein